jgi:hypothetical protein
VLGPAHRDRLGLVEGGAPRSDLLSGVTQIIAAVALPLVFGA